MELKNKTKRKASGKCPYCEKSVSAIVIEENTLRRDKCQCPSCYKIIYVCRWPGCYNYTVAGDFYDDELCPRCSEDISRSTTGILKGALKIVVSLAIAKGINKDKNKK
jgi:ribosomal protein S27AE